MLNQKFTIQAVTGSKGYKSFGIRASLASLYGEDPDKIVVLEVEIAEDQEKPKPNEHSNDEADYWGWLDTGSDRLSLVWPQYFLLNMCFPYGTDSSEEAGKGKAYRLKIIKELDNKPE